MSNSTAENPLSLRNFSIVNKDYSGVDKVGASDVNDVNCSSRRSSSAQSFNRSNNRRKYRRNRRRWNGSNNNNNPSAPYFQERKTLMEYGIHKYYDYHKNSSSSYYKQLNLTNHAFVYGKVVYVVVKGTNLMYIFPYDLLITHDWFNNALGNNGFKSNRIDLPTGNILLPIDCPIPLRFNLVYNVMMSANKLEYMIKSEFSKIKEMFDYYGIDVGNE